MESTERKTLIHFLDMPLCSSIEVLKKFAKLENAFFFKHPDSQSFVYVPGTRKDRVLLLAHADTAWDEHITNKKVDNPKLVYEHGKFKNKSSEYGIGADNRAGCAILYLLKDLGHSLLVTDGEDQGLLSSKYLSIMFPALFEELNSHSYIIQFDLGGKDCYKCYSIPVTKEFRAFIEKETGFHNIDGINRALSDVDVLAYDICGVNLSIGYSEAHNGSETLNYKDWKNTYDIARKMLTKKQKQYPIEEIFEV